MEELLQLSDEQAAQVQHIRDEHFIRTRPLQNQMHEIRLHLLDEIFAFDPDERSLKNYSPIHEAKQIEFVRNLYTHFHRLKAVCTPEQTKALKLMLRDLIERKRPQGAQGGRSQEHRSPPPH